MGEAVAVIAARTKAEAQDALARYGERIAPTLEGAHADGRRKPMRARDDAEGALDDGSRRERKGWHAAGVSQGLKSS